MIDFDKSSVDNRVQATDRDTGSPMWQVEALDGDPAAVVAQPVHEVAVFVQIHAHQRAGDGEVEDGIGKVGLHRKVS